MSYMFRTRGFIFRKTVVYAVLVCFTCISIVSNLLYRNYIYNRLPEDEPSCSKNVEDIKN